MKGDTSLKLNRILGKRTFSYYLLIVLGVLQSVLSVGLALAIKTLVNAYEVGGDVDKVINSSILLFAIVLTSFLVGVLSKIISAKYTAKIECKLKSKVFESFVGGSYSDISSNSAGEVISKFSVDASRVSNVYANLPYSVIATASHIVAILITLFILQPTFTLIVVVLGIIALLITFLVRKVLVKFYKRVRSKDSEISSFIGETTKNALVVKAFGAEDHISLAFNAKTLSYKTARLKHAYLGALLTSITALAFTLFYAFSVLYGVNGMLSGVENINFGVIIAVLQLITQIKTPINNISAYITVYTEMKVSANRLFTLIYSKDEKTVVDGEFEGVEVNSACYSYGEKEILSNCNLTINKGDKILIKGQSGEGKSTLLKLLMGIYTPSSGEVKVKINGKGYLPTNLKDIFSFVPQDNMLFLGSVKENITFNKNYLDEKILKVLDLASIDFIDKTSDGLNKNIGENGLNLSVGQGQRIALARGLISNNPVLILDEATSSLDENTEEKVLENIASLKDLTVVFVSHKLAFEKYANKVYNLSGGCLSLVTADNSKDDNA
ncbi:MAG: ABC transporter ATP-binding protein [Clostridia bacterium]|nr:ABC transporter ATP-binding protein [Clostridia bacterium]